jgi:hypothetical protein
MSTMNVDGAVSTMTNASFIRSVAVIAIASVGVQMWTDWARNNLVDLGVTGGDAIYAAVAGLLALAVLPSKYGRPAAMGATAAGLLTVGQEMGVV